MKHIDLFSGIGGFALAVDTVWPGSDHIFCDNEPFSQQVIKKHWQSSKIYGDIKTLTNTRSQKQRGISGQSRKESAAPWESCDIITGGFPCQPFSAAGKRKGTDDNRYLWPQMFRVIGEFKPTYVIAENVRGLVNWSEGMVLEQVCADLESIGYEVQTLIIPAVAVNAPHRRDRVWFVAYSNDNGRRASEYGNQLKRTQKTNKRENITQLGIVGQDKNDSNSTSERLEREKREKQQRNSRRSASQGRGQSYSWNENWTKIAAKLCRVDDGLPARLDGFELTKSAHRKARLKALGNAIVPQVAIEIMKAIKLSEE